ncbi:MAG: Xaa-Pro peptidase family protein [Pirellulaceae bacterium]|jgi:Xaa-Pro aminopeptidase|nr:Xaa-Pro peptidase family protein [Pirellulaceae bacterium]
MTELIAVPGLTAAGCGQRQQLMRDRLRINGLDAALLTLPQHVHYLSGHWEPPVRATALALLTDGPSVLALSSDSHDHITCADCVTFEAQKLCTLVDDQIAAALNALRPCLDGVQRIGCDVVQRASFLRDFTVEDLGPLLLALRRRKAPDEIAMIRHGISGCEAAFARARKMLRPGVLEIQVYAAMQQAAVNAVGEPIGPFGNDFQAGTPGGPPRQRAVEAGEMMPLDIGVIVRGYGSDLCRTFAVDGNPSAAQIDAHKRITETLAHIEEIAHAGVRCRQIYDRAFKMLDGHNGWRFFHHLGHGIGLASHEAPRLNPNWDDTLQIGDVIAVEPGLYGDNLRGGIRIEHDYLVTETGLERLSHYPVDL